MKTLKELPEYKTFILGQWDLCATIRAKLRSMGTALTEASSKLSSEGRMWLRTSAGCPRATVVADQVVSPAHHRPL